MAANTVCNFEITGYGEVKLTVDNPYGRVVHTYFGVGADVIRKIVNASKAPELSEVEAWIKADRDRRDKNRVSCVEGCGFYYQD